MGRMPATVEKAVIKMGRNRTRPASSIASVALSPSSIR